MILLSKCWLVIQGRNREGDKFATVFTEWRSHKHQKQVVRSQRRDHLQPDCEAILWKVDEATFLCEGQLARMTIFPKIAVMPRSILIIEWQIIWLSKPWLNSSEQ